MKPRRAALSAGLALALLAAPAVARAADVGAQVVDRADFYEPAAGPEGADGTVSLMATQLAQISSEMKYFTKYESHGNYDLGFSAGDGYNAMGYYQFDRRWSLVPFARYCLDYDAGKYAALQVIVDRQAEVTSDAVPMYDRATGSYTEVGQLVVDAWHAAYQADPAEFSLLQDNYAYNGYYAVTERWMASSLGISMAGRADCAKGLVWSMTNLFGTGGVQKFIRAANLTNDLSDRAFVNRLCDAVVSNVAAWYPSQPQYHQGWINRYKNERADCLGRLGAAPSFADAPAGSWYSGAVSWVADRGYMNGYDDGTFGPEDTLSRAQMAAILWNQAGKPAPARGVSSHFSDCAEGTFYAGAVAWCAESGVVSGYDDGTFRPEEPLRRQDLAVLLYRIEGTPAATGDLSRFPDAGKVTVYAVEAVRWAVGEGILSGTGEGQLDPLGTVDRASAAAIVTRWLHGA